MEEEEMKTGRGELIRMENYDNHLCDAEVNKYMFVNKLVYKYKVRIFGSFAYRMRIHDN
jgi:hypothetical protein